MKHIETVFITLVVIGAWLAVMGLFWDLGNGSVVEASLWRLAFG